MERDSKVVSIIKPAFGLWFVFMIGGLFFFTFLIVNAIANQMGGTMGSAILWSLLFASMFGAILLVVRDFKYIVLSKRVMKTYSLFRPFGKSVDLTKYVGMIISEEYSTLGSYKTIYIVDENMFTAIKLSSLYYKNFEELFAGIDLPQIKSYDFNVKKYLLLLFTGRMKVQPKCKKK